MLVQGALEYAFFSELKEVCETEELAMLTLDTLYSIKQPIIQAAVNEGCRNS